MSYRLFESVGSVLAVSKPTQRRPECVPGLCPVERRALARQFLERELEGLHGLFEAARSALPFAKQGQRCAQAVLRPGPIEWPFRARRERQCVLAQNGNRAFQRVVVAPYLALVEARLGGALHQAPLPFRGKPALLARRRQLQFLRRVIVQTQFGDLRAGLHRVDPGRPRRVRLRSAQAFERGERAIRFVQAALVERGGGAGKSLLGRIAQRRVGQRGHLSPQLTHLGLQLGRPAGLDPHTLDQLLKAGGLQIGPEYARDRDKGCLANPQPAGKLSDLRPQLPPLCGGQGTPPLGHGSARRLSVERCWNRGGRQDGKPEEETLAKDGQSHPHRSSSIGTGLTRSSHISRSVAPLVL